MNRWPNDIDGADIAFKEHPMHHFNACVLFDAILESAMTGAAKTEIIDWLYLSKKLDADQYQLALSRIEHLEKQRTSQS